MVRRRLPHAVLSGQDATTRAVSDALNEADWIHPACHGEQDLSSPSEGRLLMYDGALTARQLARHRVPHRRLAMLSACETVRGGVELADEAITLASAIQLAGFHHVIGTLRAVGMPWPRGSWTPVYGGLSADGWSAEQSARGVHLTCGSCALAMPRPGHGPRSSTRAPEGICL